MRREKIVTSNATQSVALESLIASLRSTHALEKQQVAVLEGHLEIFEDFPELHARVTQHIIDTRDQARRLESVLEACGSSSSMIKDAVLSVMGLGQSSVQGLGSNAVLKAVGADVMQEHLEIASYRMMLVLAEEANMPDICPRLQETLREEEAMATWFDENLSAITRRYVEINAGEDKVDQSPEDDDQTPEGETPPTVWQTLENASEQNSNKRLATNPKATNSSEVSKATPEPETTQDPKTSTAVPASRDD